MDWCKQCIGVDISKSHFAVKFMAFTAEFATKVLGSSGFANTTSGITAFQNWIDAEVTAGVPFTIAMEAMGVYHENVAHYLQDRGYSVAILLPNKVKAFARSLNQHSKTDAIDAGIIARLGLERQLPIWEPASTSLRQLRQLTRERQSIGQERRRHQNKLHALEHSHFPSESSRRRHRASIRLLS